MCVILSLGWFLVLLRDNVESRKMSKIQHNYYIPEINVNKFTLVILPKMYYYIM